MNNKEFIAALAARNEMSKVRAADLLEQAVRSMLESLAEGDAVNIANFGVMEVRKRNERLSINPVSKKRVLIPPRLALGFKPAVRLKSTFKNLNHASKA